MKMIWRGMVAIALLLATGPVSAETAQALKRERDIYPIIKMQPGTPYAELRAQAIKNGFRPVANKNRDQQCPAGTKKYCDLYKETLTCIGDGETDCRFLLSYAESWFIVQTKGAPGELKITKVEWLDPAERRETAQAMKWRY